MPLPLVRVQPCIVVLPSPLDTYTYKSNTDTETGTLADNDPEFSLHALRKDMGLYAHPPGHRVQAYPFGNIVFRKQTRGP